MNKKIGDNVFILSEVGETLKLAIITGKIERARGPVEYELGDLSGTFIGSYTHQILTVNEAHDQIDKWARMRLVKDIEEDKG